MSAPAVNQVHIHALPDSLKASEESTPVTELDEANSERAAPLRFLYYVTDLFDDLGMETHGIAPIPAAQRTDTRWYQMFFVWFGANMNILSFGTGTAGPAFFSLGVRDSIAIIVVTSLVTCILPAYFAVFGPKLGTRAMVQSRFSFGYYGSIIPSAFNVLSMQGFLILNCIIGGQTLASVSSHLNDTLGIVIISLISLSVTFLGYRFLHWYESVAWIPSAVAFIAMLALGYPQLHTNLYAPVPAASVASILSFTSTIAANVISWSPMTPDYGIYHSPAASSTRLFLYTYLGFITSIIPSSVVGAAFAAAAPNVPVWNTAFQDSSSVGGLLYGVLSPLGSFGKFLTVLVALGVPSAAAPTMYTFSTSLMAVSRWFSLLPRWVYIIISEAILIPVAIIGARKYYATFVDTLSIIGYWSAAYTGIVTTEHVLFRGGSLNETAYPTETWNSPKLLPRSIPAVLAFMCAFGALVPFMSQAWYVGPVAKDGSGDCGIYVGFVVSVLCYALFRRMERWWDRRRRNGVEVRVVDGDELKVQWW